MEEDFTGQYVKYRLPFDLPSHKLLRCWAIFTYQRKNDEHPRLLLADALKLRKVCPSAAGQANNLITTALPEVLPSLQYNY